MKYTDTKPTRPGFYWWKPNDAIHAEVAVREGVYEVVAIRKTLVARPNTAGAGSFILTCCDGLWSDAPVEKPEGP